MEAIVVTIDHVYTQRVVDVLKKAGFRVQKPSVGRYNTKIRVTSTSVFRVLDCLHTSKIPFNSIC